MNKTRFVAVILVLSGLVTVAYGASLILTESFPAVIVPSAPVLTSTCATASGGTLQSAFDFTQPSAGTGVLQVACNNNIPPGPAFTASAGTVTYSFSPAPSGYTAIALVIAPTTNLTPCPTSAPSTGLLTLTTTGGSVTFASSPTGSQLVTGNYLYCAYYSTTPGSTLAAFSISWSQ